MDFRQIPDTPQGGSIRKSEDNEVHVEKDGAASALPPHLLNSSAAPSPFWNRVFPWSTLPSSPGGKEVGRRLSFDKTLDEIVPPVKTVRRAQSATTLSPKPVTDAPQAEDVTMETPLGFRKRGMSSGGLSSASSRNSKPKDSAKSGFWKYRDAGDGALLKSPSEDARPSFEDNGGAEGTVFAHQKAATEVRRRPSFDATMPESAKSSSGRFSLEKFYTSPTRKARFMMNSGFDRSNSYSSPAGSEPTLMDSTPLANTSFISNNPTPTAATYGAGVSPLAEPPLAPSAESDLLPARSNLSTSNCKELLFGNDDAYNHKRAASPLNRFINNQLRNPSNESFFLDGADASVELLMAESAPVAISASSSTYLTTSTSMDTFRDAASVLSADSGNGEGGRRKIADQDGQPSARPGSSSSRSSAPSSAKPTHRYLADTYEPMLPLNDLRLDENPADLVSTPAFEDDDEAFLTSEVPEEKEFDPNASIWIMAFDSPPRKKDGRRKVGGSLLDEMNEGRRTPLEKQAPSLIDMQNVFSTPQSIPKYTERDMERLKSQLTAKFEKEFELAQLEIQELESKRAEAVGATRKMQSTLNEWEKFIRETIAKKEHTETRARIEIKTLSASLEKMTMERDHVSKEYEALSQQFQKFHSDAEAEKEVKNLKIEKMAKMLEESEGRYNNLRAHAEERLESANVEISKVRGMLEKETSTLRTKVTMAELHIASLEKTLESKTEENVELSKICEQLLQQIES